MEYEVDEWVLDAATDFPEPEGDSRWGSDNDIHKIALTWDLYNLYITVSCTAFNTTLMLFIDTECGGTDDLTEVDYFRRNIRFSDFTPNFLLATTLEPGSVTAAYTDCRQELTLLGSNRLDAWFLQDGFHGGALEVAVPWKELGRFHLSGNALHIPDKGRVLSLLAVLTRDEGSGVGDAAPDPSSILENDPTRLAICDNTIRIPLDADEDGSLDLGVSPRDAASFTLSGKGTERQELPLGLEIAQKIIAPESGESLQFRPLLQLDSYTLPVYVTARVYSSSGQLVDIVYEESPRRFTGAAPVIWDEWDGRDFRGNMVPGGIYILTVSGGAAKDAATEVVKGTFAVIR
jgi:hypothetical protein